MSVFTLAVTGPRDYHGGAEPIVQALTRIRSSLPEGTEVRIILGGARGFDAWVAYVATQLKITYLVAFPWAGYPDYYWLGGDKQKPQPAVFESIVRNAVQVVFTCERLYVNGRHSNLVRNDWMLERVDGLLAGVADPIAHARGKGGTAAAIRSALRMKLPIAHI